MEDFVTHVDKTGVLEECKSLFSLGLNENDLFPPSTVNETLYNFFTLQSKLQEVLDN